jgi:hypothetical protein
MEITIDMLKLDSLEQTPIRFPYIIKKEKFDFKPIDSTSYDSSSSKSKVTHTKIKKLIKI